MYVVDSTSGCLPADGRLTGCIRLLAFFLVVTSGCGAEKVSIDLSLTETQDQLVLQWSIYGAAGNRDLRYSILVLEPRASSWSSAFVTSETSYAFPVSSLLNGVYRFRIDARDVGRLLASSNEVSYSVERDREGSQTVPSVVGRVLNDGLGVVDVIWSPDSRSCAGSDAEAVLHIFDCETLQSVTSVAGAAFQRPLAWDDNGSRLLIGRFGKLEVRRRDWALDTAAADSAWGLLRAGRFAERSTAMVYVGAGPILVWADLETGENGTMYTFGDDIVAVDQCGDRVLAGDAGGSLMVGQLAGSGTDLVSSVALPVAGVAPVHVSWRADCAAVLVRHQDQATVIWRVSEDLSMSVEARIRSGVLDPAGELVAELAGGRELKLFSVAAPELVTSATVAVGAPRRVSWSLDGRYLLVVGNGVELLEVLRSETGTEATP